MGKNILHNQECVNCGESFSSKRSDAKYCHKSCKLDAFRRKKAELEYIYIDKPNSSFIENMCFYTKDEIIKAYHAFLNWRCLFDVVKCKCHGDYVCYPHRLEILRAMYSPAQIK